MNGKSNLDFPFFIAIFVSQTNDKYETIYERAAYCFMQKNLIIK